MENKKNMVTSLAEEMAQRLIEKLKEGVIPWQKTWDTTGLYPIPYNPITKKMYRGGNLLQLFMQDYDDRRWLTYKQAQSIGAQVRKGDKSTAIIYWKFDEMQTKLDDQGNPILDDNGHEVKERVKLERPRPFISHVFNAEQIDGMPPLSSTEKIHEWEPLEKAEEILTASGAKIEHKQQGRAYYSLTEDKIVLPVKTQFHSPEGYYATALHELSHWTGHETRLNRDMGHPFGSGDYAKEELRAELASAVICTEIGVPNLKLDNTAAYLKSWIEALQNDPKEILRAASSAEKIREYVMNFTQTQKLDVTQTEEQEQVAVSTESKTQATPSPDTPSPRIYFSVPYKERNQVKELGARWDRTQKSWYIPEGVVAKEKFSRWIANDNEKEAKMALPTQETTRLYLYVPYREKEEAKKAGARWDVREKSWYIEGDVDKSKLSRWLPENHRLEQTPAMQPQEEFAEALRSLGCVVSGEHPIMDGQAHRIETTEDRPGEKAGFYIAYMDGRPAGYIKNNRTDEEVRWKYSGQNISREVIEQVKAEYSKKQAERLAELEASHEQAATRCAEKFNALERVQERTPYMKKKDILPYTYHNAPRKTEEQTLCVPLYDVNGKIWSLQYIQEDGTKRFAKGSKKEGCFHAIYGERALKQAPVLVIAEGYATAATLSQTLGTATVAALTASNLEAVAKALHEKYPDKPIVIAGDDDRSLKKNVGREKAEGAAKAVGGIALFPTFASDESGRDFTDWNDLALKSKLGRDGVRLQLTPVVESLMRQNSQQKERELSHSQSRTLTR